MMVFGDAAKTVDSLVTELKELAPAAAKSA
jgi:hypothetical protein